MVWSAVIGGAASLLGGALANKGAKRQNQMQQAQSAKQMAFQERMSNTAHQRAMADMKKAGINPILAAGQPASSPGGSQANITDEIAPAISSAMQLKRFQQEIRNLKATERNINANTRNANNTANIKAPAADIMGAVSDELTGNIGQTARAIKDFIMPNRPSSSSPNYGGTNKTRTIHIRRGND